MTGPIYVRAKPPTETFLSQTFVRPPAGAMLPWLPHASALQTLRNISVVMNQHLRRKPERLRLRTFQLETDTAVMNWSHRAQHERLTRSKYRAAAAAAASPAG